MTVPGYLATQVLPREQARRRVLLLGVGTMIVLGTSPVFGHHLATRADALLAGHDHVANLCLIALHLLLAPVHRAFHLLLTAGVAYAIVDRVRAWRGLVRTLGALQAREPLEGEPIGDAAARVGLDRALVRVVEGLPNPAFTAGFWRPRVYVDQRLPDVLDPAQLDAVLAHEHAHLVRRDPLRLSLLRFLACTLFYIPALRRLAEDLADEAEIDADDAYGGRSPSGTPLVLASAIVVLAQWAGARRRTMRMGQPPRGAAAGFLSLQPFQRVDLLERRVRRLAGEETTVGTHVTRRSLGGAVAVLMAALVSGIVMVHPMPASTASPVGAAVHEVHGEAHCQHQNEAALRHLFCLGWRSHSADAPCPHTGR